MGGARAAEWTAWKGHHKGMVTERRECGDENHPISVTAASALVCWPAYAKPENGMRLGREKYQTLFRFWKKRRRNCELWKGQAQGDITSPHGFGRPTSTWEDSKNCSMAGA